MRYVSKQWIANQKRLRDESRKRIMSHLNANSESNPYIMVMGTTDNVRKVLNKLIGNGSKVLVRIRVETI
jgi:hypothetical protein